MRGSEVEPKARRRVSVVIPWVLSAILIPLAFALWQNGDAAERDAQAARRALELSEQELVAVRSSEYVSIVVGLVSGCSEADIGTRGFTADAVENVARGEFQSAQRDAEAALERLPGACKQAVSVAGLWNRLGDIVITETQLTETSPGG